MQSFDCEVKLLIFPRNKPTDQNKFDNCKKVGRPEQNCCSNPTCTWRYCMPKDSINADIVSLVCIFYCIKSKLGK